MNESKPFYCNPKHPNFNRRAYHHDYTRAAKYLITFLKKDTTPNLAQIEGLPPFSSYESAYSRLSSTGSVVPIAIADWIYAYPQIHVPAYAIMPDHIHLCVDVTYKLPYGLSRAIGRLKGFISSKYHMSLPEDIRPEQMQTLFEKGFNDRIAYDQEQWNRQIHYTLDNPRRYMLKKCYPDYMLRRWIITVGNEQYVAKGNIFLLKQPHLFQVKYSRKFNEKESQDWMDRCRSLMHNGSIAVSPFIHPMEKAARDYAHQEGFGLIRVCTNGFAERESASGVEFELMAQGRLLLIGPLECNTRKETLTYDWAQSLNRLAASIVETFGRCVCSGLIRPL
ncbi:MAG: transposase [Muribaculaceae bacterium]|nr:transposase [Muribaculaceae bacterium]